MSTNHIDTAGLKTAIVAAHLLEPVAQELIDLARAADRSTSAEVRIAIREHLSKARQAGVAAV
jgi:hypothetical protein